jgi:hypothetical protein
MFSGDDLALVVSLALESMGGRGRRGGIALLFSSSRTKHLTVPRVE